MANRWEVLGLTTQDQVSELFIATLDRAPARGGLDYWVQEVNSGAMTIAEVAESFFAQPETQKMYPAGTTNAEFVAAVFSNAFDRAPASSYWVDQLDAGLPRSTFILNILQGAYNDPAATPPTFDDSLVSNQRVASEFFAASAEFPWTGTAVDQANFLAIAGAVLKPVTGDPTTGAASIDASKALTIAFVDDGLTGYALTSAGSVAEGSPLTLTLTAASVSAVDQVFNITVVGDTISGAAAAADPASDFTGLPTTVTLLAGATTATFTITPTADNVTEGSEGFKVSVLQGATTVGSAQALITDGGGTGTGTFALTANTDVATANIFNAGLVFNPGGTDRVNSLQDEDVLTGTGANPTLNATLGNANDNGGSIITPKLIGIETINAAFTGSGGNVVDAVDMQDATGIATVNITRVSQGNDAEIGNMKTAVANLSLSNTNANQADTVEFSYASGVLKGDNAAEMKLNSVDLGTLNIGQNLTIAARGVATNGIESLTLDSAGTANTVRVLNLPMDTGTAGKVVITGDQSLTLANNVNVLNPTSLAVEAVTYNGGIQQANGRLAAIDASGMTGTAALTLNIAPGLLTTGKADTSGVTQDVTITGTKGDDTFYLSDTVEAGDKIVGGEGKDTLVVFTGGITTGDVSAVEAADIRLVGNVVMDMTKIKDATGVKVRNIDNTAGISADNGDWTATLNKLTAVQGAALTIEHSTTTNNAIFDTTIVANLGDSSGTSDTVAITIAEGVNSDPRFNFTLGTNTDVAATVPVERVEIITIADSDTESNSVELRNAADHVGKITLTGGLAGTFLNLDVDTTAVTTTGLKQIDITGSTGDGVGWVDVADSATAVRLVAGTIDASGEVSDVIVRVSTTAANTDGGQTITMGAGNDTVIFDDIAATSPTRGNAGLTNADKVTGGEGKNTLVIDGHGTPIVLQQSEWDNVSGFQTLYLAGNGAGNVNTQQYFLQLDNDMIIANGVDKAMITIDNDDDSTVSTVTGVDSRLSNNGARIDATTLSANTHFTYDGEEGTGATADRIVVNDQNTNGANIIDGGDVNVQVGLDKDSVTRQLNGVQSLDVMEVRNTATVTTADLANVKNIGSIVINNDQAVLQTLNLTLNTAVADALSDSGHIASLTETETLNIVANDGKMADAAGSAIVPTAASRISLDARGLSGAFVLNVTGDAVFAADDKIDMAVNLGGATSTFDMKGGSDTVNFYGLNANGTDTVTIAVAGATSTLFIADSKALATQTFNLTGVEAINLLTAAGVKAAVGAGPFVTGSDGADIIVGTNLNDNIQGWATVAPGAGDAITAGAGSDTISLSNLLAGQTNTVSYTAAALGSGDLVKGDIDTLTNVTGNLVIDMTATVESQLKVGNVALSALTANQALGGAFAIGTNVIAVDQGADRVIQIDLNNDQLFTAADDYQIVLTGVAGSPVTYNAATDQFDVVSTAPTYVLAPDVAAVNEGGAVIFTLTTTNVAAGTVLNYTLAGTGITAADFTPAATTGTLTVLAGGVTPITVTTAADAVTVPAEGNETFTLALDGGLGTSAAVTINDGAGVVPVNVTAGGAFTATAGVDIFVYNYDIVGGRATTTAAGGVATITGFNAAQDILRFDNTATATASTEAAFLATAGVVPSENPFVLPAPGATSFFFDPNGAAVPAVGGVTLTGILDQGLVQINAEIV